MALSKNLSLNSLIINSPKSNHRSFLTPGNERATLLRYSNLPRGEAMVMTNELQHELIIPITAILATVHRIRSSFTFFHQPPWKSNEPLHLNPCFASRRVQNQQPRPPLSSGYSPFMQRRYSSVLAADSQKIWISNPMSQHQQSRRREKGLKR